MRNTSMTSLVMTPKIKRDINIRYLVAQWLAHAIVSRTVEGSIPGDRK